MKRELLARTPEPELMDSPEQVQAYAGADFSESNQRFADFLVANFQPHPGQGRLVDLGCGPGDICIRLARALPKWRITGLDAGENMLASATGATRQHSLTDRVTLHPARLPEHGLPPQSFDAVVSNSLLHHLPDPAILWHSIRDLARTGAWVQVMDLNRPDNAAVIAHLVDQYAASEPELLRRDFANSLHAAWRVNEVNGQLAKAGLALECLQVSDRHWQVAGFLNTHH